jgi:hypothetical protein
MRDGSDKTTIAAVTIVTKMERPAHSLRREGPERLTVELINPLGGTGPEVPEFEVRHSASEREISLITCPRDP